MVWDDAVEAITQDTEAGCDGRLFTENHANASFSNSLKMGFSSSLQGRSSHEALLARQDAELRLLESFRRWLLLRIKCDRDYAVALGSVNVRLDSPEELSTSPLAQSIQAAVEDSEALSSLFKQNADYLANVTVEKLNALLQDKRSSRKFYSDEYQRLVAELSVVQDSVGRSRLEYEKALDAFKSSKSKYEECIVNTAKGKGTSKKTEEALRDKFQRSIKRLHVAHNDYVLLLLEAADYERDFRTVLLPGLLEFQQAVQEDLVSQCRNILTEVSERTDFSSESFLQLFNKLKGRVQQITAESEFKEFIEKHKSPPQAAQPPIFDSKLSLNHDNSHTLVNPLRPDKITVDDLTLEALKQKLRMLEQRLTAVQNEMTSKQTILSQKEAEFAALAKTSSAGTELSVARRQVEGVRRQVTELRCLEQKWQRQIDAIAEAVSKLGGQVPSACELHICDGNSGATVLLDEEPNLQSSAVSSNGHSVSVSSLGKRRGQSLVDLLRRPFSRKSMTPPSSPSSQSKQLREEPEQNKSEENLSTIPPLVEVKDESPSTLEDTAPPLPVDALTVPPPLPPTPSANESMPAVAAGLAEQEWFHGVLPREEVVRLLVNDGDFLVRETTRHEERQVVLSCSWSGHKHFIVQTTPEGLYRFEGPAFPTVQELIMYQLESELPVTTKSGAILKHPVPRERWELNNDDLELVEKIGRGNFGDVYKAVLRPTGLSVAIKTCRHTLPEEQKKKFLQEGRILKQYEHKNIVQLIGICVQKQPIMIVMELVPGGSLLNFLRQKSTNLSSKQLLLMCADVAAGMGYLESRNCIHRDLAARNCLVGEANIVKISDFGMSREEQEYIVSDGMKQIPIKWTAPEALNYGKYTSLCDVWSFGVLCWEVFSRGGVPYSGLSNTRARQMIDAGYRMPAADGTPEELYRLMRRCWEYEPERRPHFEEISQMLDVLIKAAS